MAREDRLYSRQIATEWIRDNLDLIDAEGWSYRDIGNKLKRRFGLDKSPSTATIGRYLSEAREAGIQGYSDEALELLKPENFPEFRKLFKSASGPYQTSKSQFALFWVLYALTMTVDLDDWVIEHFELPEDINQDIVERDKLLTFILLMAPRMGKTMTMVHGLILLYCVNPNLRVVYCQGIASTTEDINALLMVELETNEQLLQHFGPFRSEDKPWSNKNGFVLARRTVPSITPSFLPVGINSNVRSRDADIIVIDDPEDLTRAESEANVQKDYRKITAEFMQRREPHTPVLMVGSHLPLEHGDVFLRLEDNLEELQTEGQTIIMRKRPAHDLEKCEGGDTHWDCLEWPEMRHFDFLEAQRAMLDSEFGHGMFEAVYQQEGRIPGSRPFPPEMVKGNFYLTEPDEVQGIQDATRSWKEQTKVCPKCGGKLYTTLGFDPAAGDGKKASYSALAVIDGCIQCRTLYLVDYWQKRQSPELHAGTIASYAKSFDVMWVRVEVNAYQKALARDDTLREAARELRFGIDEWMTDDRKNTAEFGIPNLSRYMRDGKFSVPAKTHQDRMYGREMERALVRYPVKPNDLPMATWLAAGMCWQVWDLYSNLDPVYMPGREDRIPQYLIDNPVRLNLALARE